jgi:diguanylate cyclase (GGDEF)-like protein
MLRPHLKHRSLRLLARAGPSNWPFALKMAFCPLLAMFALFSVGIYGIVGLDAQAALIRAVVRQDLAGALDLSDAATQLQAINGAVYRLTTLQASHAKALDVARETDRLANGAAELADRLTAQNAAGRSGPDRESLQRVIGQIRIYHDAIEVFGSMLELDFGSAVAFIQPFDSNAGAVLAALGTLARHAVHAANERAGQSAGIAGRVGFSVEFTLAALSLVLGLVTTLLTRATVHSVRQIAAATEIVARGNTRLDVDALARGDELGIIVRSLAIFQANVSQIAFLAQHDALTRLPNRVFLAERIEHGLRQADRGAGFAVLCLDLDRFKAVNDTLGHGIGDGLLREVANRLLACTREGDVVARLGGDEFAVILYRMADPSEIDPLAARIVDVISAGYDVGGHPISIGVSIGIAMAPADGFTAEDLLRNADTALYGAKSGGRGMSCFFESKMNGALQARRKLEIGLQLAIKNQEFEVFYQPLVEAQSHSICAFEALVRWRHPELGMIQPDAFIGVAESTGMIGVIGHWVLRQACRDAVTWPSDIKIAVNLSPAQFREKSLVGNVRAALADSGLQAGRLELEITESVLLRDSESVLATLREIKALGVKIAMDDFGTGYSSLSYLRSFPFDKVKIDRSFIKDLPHDENAMAIVRAIVGLSETFGMQVTAEGVETDEQAVKLALGACTQLQGYLFSQPKPASDIPGLIRTLAAAAASRTEPLQTARGTEPLPALLTAPLAAE